MMKPHQLRRAIKANPNQCPFPLCKSEAIEAGPIIEEDAATPARHVECNKCGGTWYERYTLADAEVTP